jgi:hypothetical protein
MLMIVTTINNSIKVNPLDRNFVASTLPSHSDRRLWPDVMLIDMRRSRRILAAARAHNLIKSTHCDGVAE